MRATDRPRLDQPPILPAPKLSIKLPISKDNTIFGVRSTDPAGHKSPTVYPMPTR